MKPNYHQQLSTILNGLHIDPAHYCITLAADETPITYQPDKLQNTLSDLLYRYFYCANESVSAPSDQPVDDSFINTLSRHNQSVERFDSGWSIETTDMARIAYAVKGNARRMLNAGEFVYDNPKRGPVQTGDSIRLFMHREHRDAQSGFYYVFGQTPGEDSVVLQTRLYFHTAPAGSAQLVSWITQTLNAYQIPFQFKCLNHPDLYGRSDSAVLYLQKPTVNIVLDLLGDVLPELSPYLLSSIPLFTRPIAPGIGFAESPPDSNESFGTSRCGLIARGIARAVTNQQPAEQYQESVQEIFNQIGLSIEQPYRNPNSQYPYVFPDYSVQ